MSYQPIKELKNEIRNLAVIKFVIDWVRSVGCQWMNYRAQIPHKRHLKVLHKIQIYNRNVNVYAFFYHNCLLLHILFNAHPLTLSCLCCYNANNPLARLHFILCTLDIWSVSRVSSDCYLYTREFVIQIFFGKFWMNLLFHNK